jgi:transposase-like protein
MECRLCGHPKTHKHGKMPNGHQRYFCPHCQQTFCASFDALYYYRHVSPEQIDQVLQAPSEGISLRGSSRISGLAYNTVVSIIRVSSSKAQLVHNDQVKAVETEEVSGDEMGSFVQKNKRNVRPRISK